MIGCATARAFSAPSCRIASSDTVSAVRRRISAAMGLTSLESMDDFIAANRFSVANDLDGSPVLMAHSAFSLNYTLERAPDIKATEIKEMHKAA